MGKAFVRVYLRLTMSGARRGWTRGRVGGLGLIPPEASASKDAPQRLENSLREAHDDHDPADPTSLVG